MSITFLLLLQCVLTKFTSAYPPSLAGPTILAAQLDRIFPTATPVNFQVGATINAGSGPFLTLVGQNFTEEYGAGSLRCRFLLEEGAVTVCAERITAGCTPTSKDQLTCVPQLSFLFFLLSPVFLPFSFSFYPSSLFSCDPLYKMICDADTSFLLFFFSSFLFKSLLLFLLSPLSSYLSGTFLCSRYIFSFTTVLLCSCCCYLLIIRAAACAR